MRELLPETMMDHPAIERIILARGERGMDRLARYLPPDYCAKAAEALWGARDRVMLTTGFHILAAGGPETDGPPGTFFLGRGLALCGSRVAFVCEPVVLRLLEELVDVYWPARLTPPELVRFPVMDLEPSETLARNLCSRWKPTSVVAVERCGRTEDGKHLNRRGDDITPYTAHVDYLLDGTGALTVGIGDGGNEIGMGCLTKEIAVELGNASPCVTPADHLVIATVSDWGAYGLLAYLSKHAGRDLLPTRAEVLGSLEVLAAMGAIHAMTLKPEPAVDGFPAEVEAGVVEELRRVQSLEFKAQSSKLKAQGSGIGGK
jgi:hypothetical protein